MDEMASLRERLSARSLIGIARLSKLILPSDPPDSHSNGVLTDSCFPWSYTDNASSQGHALWSAEHFFMMMSALLRRVQRSEPIAEDRDIVEVQLAEQSRDEAEGASAEGNEALDSLVDEMNVMADVLSVSVPMSPTRAVRTVDQAQRSTLRQSPRKRKSEEPTAASPNKRRSLGGVSEPRTIRSTEAKERWSAPARSNTKVSRLRTLPRSSRVTTRYSSQDFDLPSEEEPERMRPEPARSPAQRLHKTRKLVQKANTKSPLKDQGVLELNINGVNLEDNLKEKSLPVCPRGRPRTRAHPNEKTSAPADNTPTTKSHQKDPEATPPDIGKDASVDENALSAGETSRDDIEEDEARQKAAEREKKLEKALRGIEHAATLFGRKRAWAELIVAAQDIRKTKNSPEVESGEGERAIFHIQQIRSLFPVSRADNAVPIDLETLRPQFERPSRRYYRELRSFQPIQGKSDHDGQHRVKQSRDLHQHLIPELVETCKAALRTLFEGTQPMRTEFDLLAALLTMTYQTVEKAQEWEPRPTTMDAGVLGDMRNGVGKNITDLRKRFLDEARALKAEDDEKEILKRFTKLQEESQACFWQGIRERRAKILRSTRQAENVREPLVDITAQVIDVDDLNLKDNLRSSETHQSTAVPPTRVWSEPETHALLIGLQQCAGPDALRKIDDLKYKELAGIDIEDMRKRLQVLKETLQGVAAAREDPFLKHVLSFPDR